MLFYSGALAIQRYNPARLDFAMMPITEKAADYTTSPDRIVIKRVGVDTPVIPVEPFEGRWELTPHGAAYLTSSPIPGTSGNSIMYGHNWGSIFRNLEKVQPGDFIEIHMTDGSRRVFGVTATQIVSPSDIGVLAQTTDRHLTVYTCTGFLDSKRFVVSATLQSEL